MRRRGWKNREREGGESENEKHCTTKRNGYMTAVERDNADNDDEKGPSRKVHRRRTERESSPFLPPYISRAPRP